MEMPEKETLDKVLDYKLNYQDNETLEKARRLYDMSRALLLNGYENHKLHKNHDSYELEIKSGINSAIKTGYSRIILSYDPFDKYFSIYAVNWPRLPKIFGSDARTNSVMDIEFRLSRDSCFGGHFDKSTALYKPGKWEELLEKRIGEYVKSPVSPEARKQIARQKPTVQILDDKEASTAQNRSHSSDWFWDENAPGYPRHP